MGARLGYPRALLKKLVAVTEERLSFGRAISGIAKDFERSLDVLLGKRIPPQPRVKLAQVDMRPGSRRLDRERREISLDRLLVPILALQEIGKLEPSRCN